MDNTPFRIEECLAFAWNAWKRDLGVYVLLTLLLLCANAATHAVIGMIHLPLAFVTSFVLGALISGLFAGSLMAVALRGARGETPTFDDALGPFRERQGDYLIVGLAMEAGIVALGIGVLVTMVLFMFAPLLVVQGDGYQAALGRSKDLVLSRLSDAAVLYVVLLLMNVAGAVCCGIGLLVSVPLSALALVRAHALLTGAATMPEAPSLPGS